MNLEDPHAEEALWQRLLDVVRKVNSENRRYKGEITRQTRMVEDLHLLGDPAGDLLDEIVEEFKVDFASFPFNRYFLSEGIYFISYPFRRSPKKIRVINLGMLEKAVHLGRWDTQLIDPD